MAEIIFGVITDGSGIRTIAKAPIGQLEEADDQQ